MKEKKKDQKIASLHAPGVTLMGLGPGDANLLTREAWDVLISSSEIWLRTKQHPVVNELPDHLHVYSFDEYYENGKDFLAVYAAIVTKVLELAHRPEGVLYAVPGHPFIAEATGPEIFQRARQDGLPVRVVEGLSFIEPVITTLGVDPLPQTVLLDAFELINAHVPPFPPSAPAIIVQIYSRDVASEVKITLNSIYPDHHPVIYVHAAGSSKQKVEELSLYEIDRSRKIGLMTALYIPPLNAASSFESFQEVIARLRAPDGCPWDREQTHQSLRPYLLEETYEALEALDSEDSRSMAEEFGDLLLQVVLHAQIASETGGFNINDVLQMVNEKIVRRHPHVFSDVDLKDTHSVLQNWERLKAIEREDKGEGEKGLLDGVAKALPALIQADQYQSRAARVGFVWQDVREVLNKIEEEIEEICQAPVDEREGEVGDLLFALVNLARWYHIDAESALRNANRRFKDRFRYLEDFSRKEKRPLETYSLEEKLALWQESKVNQRDRP